MHHSVASAMVRRADPARVRVKPKLSSYSYRKPPFDKVNFFSHELSVICGVIT